MDINIIQNLHLDEMSGELSAITENDIIFVIDSDNFKINDDGYIEIINQFDNCIEENIKEIPPSEQPKESTFQTFPEKFDIINEKTGVRHFKVKKSTAETLKRTKPIRRKRRIVLKTFKCELCLTNFSSSLLLNRHNRLKCSLKMNNDDSKNCHLCGKTFKRIATLLGHLESHTKLKNFNCRYCNEIFNSKLLYKNHYKNIHKNETNIINEKRVVGINNDNIRKCDICDKIFNKPSHLRRHMRIHNGERPFKCNLCDAKFTQKNSLQIHEFKHSGLKPFKCTQCNLHFSQKGNLKIHESRVHSTILDNTTKYPCSQCSCIFRKLGTLNRHISDNHSKREIESKSIDFSKIMDQIASIKTSTEIKSNEQELKKDQVNDEQPNEIRSSVKLADHVKDGTIIHRTVEAVVTSEGHRQLICSFCSKRFIRPSDLLRHIRIHTREKPFECYLCKRKFAMKNALTSHLKTHENNSRKFSCGICLKNFRDIPSLENHSTEHKSDREIFQCVLCKLRFPTGNDLEKHVRQHNRKNKLEKRIEKSDLDTLQVELENPYLITENGLVKTVNIKSRIYNGPSQLRPHLCEICQASFRKISHLKQHELSHTGIRPHKCKYCEKSFKSSNALTLHVRAHLGEKPSKCSICDIRFLSNALLKRHLISHSEVRNFLCPYCQKTFKCAAGCRKHIKIHRSEIIEQIKKNLLPEEQNESNKTNLVIFESNEITDTNNLIILNSNQTSNDHDSNNINFLTLENIFEPEDESTKLNHHIIEETTTNDNIYQLNEIIPSTTSESIQSPPIQQTQEELSDRHCKFCGRLFKKPVDLRRHERTHTGERPFQCTNCAKSFSLRNTLRIHEKTHLTDIQKFSCHVCGKLFTSNGSLQVHMRIHTGAKPYKCSYCNVTFRTAGHKISHEKVHIKVAKEKGIDPKDVTTRKSKFQNLVDSFALDF